jgi:phenylacetic acid degradation operon negative regulatory protein
MKKLLKTRDRILLVLADLGDLYEQLRDPGGILGNYFEIVYGWVPYKYRKSNFRASVERMLRVGYIEKIVKNGEPYLRLTSRGRERIIRDFPIFALRDKKWNKRCTLIVFDVEEAKKREREKFRYWLLGLGAGFVQRSVYIIAYDITAEISEAVEQFSLIHEVKVFPTTLEFVGDRKKFAFEVWRIERLQKDYQKILESLKTVPQYQGRERKRLISDLRGEFLDVLRCDPLLPKELLPERWIGTEVRKLVKMLS